MENILKREGLNGYARTWEDHLVREETAETVVPDALPDVDTVLLSDAGIYLRSKEIREHTVAAEGLIRVKVLYRPVEDSGIQTVNVELPAVFRAESESLSEENFLALRMEVLRCEARVLNSRKLQVRCTVGCDVSAYGKDTVSFTSDADKETLEVKKTQVAVERIVSCTEKSFVTTEDLAVPTAGQSIGTILSYRADSQVSEIRHVAGKTVLQGKHLLDVLYLSNETSLPACERFSVPFSQIVDAGSEENSEERLILQTNECYLEPDMSSEGGHVLRFELHATVQCITRTVQTLELVSDAYSVRCPCEVTWDKVISAANRHCTTLRDTLRLELASPYPAAEVLAGTVRPSGAEFDGKTVSLKFQIDVLFRSSQGELCACQQTTSTEIPREDWNGAGCELGTPMLTEPYFTVAAGRIEARASWELRCELWEAEEHSFVSEVELKDEPLRPVGAPSLILARWDGGELWQLAKKYASRVSSIRAANGDELAEGKLLLIPTVR